VLPRGQQPAVGIWQYLDSGKWGFNAPPHFFRLAEADSRDGAE
jgi:hypothetical protein